MMSKFVLKTITYIHTYTHTPYITYTHHNTYSTCHLDTVLPKHIIDRWNKNTKNI